MTTPKETMNEKMAVFRTSPNLLRADERDDGALEADHPAHEGVDHDEQRELPPVLLQAKPDGSPSPVTGSALGDRAAVRAGLEVGRVSGPVLFGEMEDGPAKDQCSRLLEVRRRAFMLPLPSGFSASADRAGTSQLNAARVAISSTSSAALQARKLMPKVPD